MTEFLAESLRTMPLEIQGRLVDASNATLLCLVGDERCVYKPVAGERPLWDFPSGTLAGREVASYEIDALLGWDLVPCTVWRDDGPAGPGMAQQWREEASVGDLITVSAPEDVPAGWRMVLEARDPGGRPVCLAHADDRNLQRICLFDALVNNGDRKGGHVLTDPSGHIWAVDHGVTFNTENKLRTVIWGWAGDAIPDDLLDDVVRLRSTLGQECTRVDRWLEPEESEALRSRADVLISTRRFPIPSEDWPAIPWPVF